MPLTRVAIGLLSLALMAPAGQAVAAGDLAAPLCGPPVTEAITVPARRSDSCVPSLRLPPIGQKAESADPAHQATAPSRLFSFQGSSLMSSDGALQQDLGPGPLRGSRLQIVGGRGDSTRYTSDADRLLQQHTLRPENRLEGTDLFTGLKLSLPLN